MKLVYLKNGKKFSTTFDNADLYFNINKYGNRNTVSVVAKEDIELVSATEVIPFNVNRKDRYFLNGYQSWTDSHEYMLSKRLRDVKKSPHIITSIYAMTAYGDVKFYKYSARKMHGYDVFYSRGQFESFIYNLNYKTAYLIIELHKDSKDFYLISDVNGLKLEKGKEVTIFDFCYYDSYEEGLNAFNISFPKRNIEKLFGYSSWYNYYQNINEEIINRDLDALDSRFNLFQIDDGYESFVGDWLDVDEKKFPNGLKPLVEKIHSKGFKAGLWLAPFVCEKNSKLFKEHQDWLKLENGKPLKSGGNWSGHYALDLDKKEVRDYIEKCLKHYMDMGFDFFKLDFLYAAGIIKSEGKTRCQTQGEAYAFLRKVLKGKLVLGCGANIVNSIDNFDYLRVGPDVSLIFDDVAYMRLFHRERISTKVTIQNTIYRSLFNQRFFANDPDVFLLRDGNIQLSDQQRTALTKINALFGSLLLTSDDIATYDEKKKKILANALDLFKHAKPLGYVFKNNKIIIEYDLNGQKHELAYNPKKGVLEYDR